MTDQDVVLISGGAAGIGRTIASAFLNSGAAVHVFDASKKHIDEFLAKYPSATSTQANIANPMMWKPFFPICGVTMVA